MKTRNVDGLPEQPSGIAGERERESAYSLVEFVHHFLSDMFWACTIQLKHFLPVRVIRVDGPELEPLVTEQYQEMLAFRFVDFL